MAKCTGNFTISMLQDHIELYSSRKSMNLMDTTSDNNYTKVNLWIIHIIACHHDAGGRSHKSALSYLKVLSVAVISRIWFGPFTCCQDLQKCPIGYAAHPLSTRKCVAHSLRQRKSNLPVRRKRWQLLQLWRHIILNRGSQKKNGEAYGGSARILEKNGLQNTESMLWLTASLSPEDSKEVEAVPSSIRRQMGTRGSPNRERRKG